MKRISGKVMDAVLLGMLGSSLLALIGSLGPWVHTSVGDLNGIDHFGWLGAFGAALVATLAGLRRTYGTPRWAPAIAILGGSFGVAVGFVLWTTLAVFGPASWVWNHLASQWSATRDLPHAGVSTGWGLYLLFFGSLATVVCGLAALGAGSGAAVNKRLSSSRPVDDAPPPPEPVTTYEDQLL